MYILPQNDSFFNGLFVNLQIYWNICLTNWQFNTIIRLDTDLEVISIYIYDEGGVVK